jgi:hypothetical protein
VKKLLILLLLLFSVSSYAGLIIQPVLGYHTDTDDVNASDFTYSTTILNLLIGGTFGRGEKWVVGQNIISSTRTSSDGSGNDDEISLLELGPRVQYYFTGLKTAYIAFTYNLYANGERTLAGVSQEVEGSSMVFSIGYQLKMSRSTYIGFSLNYHSISLEKQTVAETTTDISQSYTLLYPAIEMSFRF